MDSGALAELLKGTQVPDTQKIKEATSNLQKNYYPKPECLISLIEIVCTHPEANVRQMGAVAATRLVPRHWAKLGAHADKRPQLRELLLAQTLAEEAKLVRHSKSRLIAAIGSVDIPNNEWPELLQGIVSACTTGPVKHREVCSFLLFALLEDDSAIFVKEVHNLLKLFQQTITDPESTEVRINTMQAAGCLLDLVDIDDDQASLAAVQELIPAMVEVLKVVIDSADEENIKLAFEVIQSLLFYESAIVNNHLRDLMEFMVDLGANKAADADSRIMALTFLNQAVRFRRMKVQGMKNVRGLDDMGSLLTVRAMAIATEIDDDEDEDEITPARTALGLIDQLSEDLPPKQVIVPLLKELPVYSQSENPALRKAGVLALGNCVEGAPDFVATQLTTILPILVALLRDSDVAVRSAALLALTRLADEMADSLSPFHKDLMSAVVQNLEFATTNKTVPTPETADKKNVQIISIVCAALDAVVNGLEEKEMTEYGPELISKIAPLINHPSFKVKAAAAGALGAIAQSIGTKFLPYFKDTVMALAPYLTRKETEEDLELRSNVCDSMGRFAGAVGPEAFSPYLNDLMLASEEALKLGNPRLRETSFILWSTLAKVYEGQFAQYLSGVMRALFESLELDEEEISVSLEDAAAEIAEETLIAQGKKMKIKAVAEGEEDMDETDDLEDFMTVSPQALEKEIAIEVVADVIGHACDAQQVEQFLEKAVEMVTPLVEHTYEGIRRAAMSCLYRCYTRVVQLTGDQSGRTWKTVPPLEPTDAINNLGALIVKATTVIWEDEMDRNVVSEINRNIAGTLKQTGPSLLLRNPDFSQLVLSVVQSILKRSHPSQQDFGDFEEDETAQHGTAEYDWVTIDSALDVIIALAAVLKADAINVWKLFEKDIMKLAVSDECQERSVAIGVVAEMTAHIGEPITPYTEKILKNVLRRLSDTDLETKSNAAYATGQLILHSTATQVYLPSYPTILQKLESMLEVKEARVSDNAAGCLCRMIMAHAAEVPLPHVLPALVGLLPLKEDFEENSPVFECIYGLYNNSEPTIQSLTPQLIPVFGQVLSPPAEQLTDDTRDIVRATVTALYKAHPDLFANHKDVLNIADLP